MQTFKNRTNTHTQIIINHFNPKPVSQALTENYEKPYILLRLIGRINHKILTMHKHIKFECIHTAPDLPSYLAHLLSYVCNIIVPDKMMPQKNERKVNGVWKKPAVWVKQKQQQQLQPPFP